MAETEQLTILRLKTEGAESVKDLKDNIKALKQVIDQTKIGTKEYQQALDLLKVNQNALKDAMYATSASMDDIKASAYGVSETYNSLAHRMAALKEELRNTDVATDEGKEHFKDLARQINEVNDKLKSMDELQGNFQRNVGNYPGSVGHSFDEAFGKIADAAGGLDGAIGQVTSVMSNLGVESKAVSGTLTALSTVAKALASTKGIGAMVNTIKNLIKGEKAATVATEEQTVAMEGEAAATVTATAATNSFKTALMATGIGAIIILLGEMTAHANELGEALNGVAKSDKDILEEERKYYEEVKKNLEDEVAMYQAAGATREEIMNAELDKLQQLADGYSQYLEDMLEVYRRSSEEVSDAMEQVKEGKDELEKGLLSAKYSLESFVSAAETSKAQKGMTDLEKKIDSVHRQTKAYRATLDTLFDQGIIRAQEYMNYLQRLRDAEAVMVEEVKKPSGGGGGAWAQGKKEAEALVKAAEDAYKTEEELLTEKYKEDLAKLQKYHKDSTALTQKYNDDLQKIADKRLEDVQKVLDAQTDADIKAAEEQEALQLRMAKAGEKLTLDQIKSREAYDKRIIELTYDEGITAESSAQEIADAEERKQQRIYELQVDTNRKRLAALEQFSQDALDRLDTDSYLEYQQEIADLEVEMEVNALTEKKRLRDKDREDARKDAEARKQLLTEVASTTSSILGSIADMYEDDEENSEKNANKIKALRIASATIDTLSGAIGAFMQASETIPPPYGQIIGAAEAAAITATGIANIAKMKKTQVSGDAGSSSMPSAMTSAPTLQTQVSNVRSVTSASEEERLNQMASDQRVYILSSDIEASQNRIKTQVSESSF